MAKSRIANAVAVVGTTTSHYRKTLPTDWKSDAALLLRSIYTKCLYSIPSFRVSWGHGPNP
jgi:hypothetical protein